MADCRAPAVWSVDGHPHHGDDYCRPADRVPHRWTGRGPCRARGRPRRHGAEPGDFVTGFGA
ncbi:hypothetical protein, partial [Kitasatospora sp. NPDC007106]|uniref:hypothetical protein n=1 Tax=Kitasatospora sp. NPDC007106 TaxID=3156914 RepID=UPI003405306D